MLPGRLTKVTNALRNYEHCVSRARGRNKVRGGKCRQLDDCHDDFEEAVTTTTGRP